MTRRTKDGFRDKTLPIRHLGEQDLSASKPLCATPNLTVSLLLWFNFLSFTQEAVHADMGRVEKTVFISYRRSNAPWALAIFQNLTQHGYDVFFDYLGIASGDF